MGGHLSLRVEGDRLEVLSVPDGLTVWKNPARRRSTKVSSPGRPTLEVGALGADGGVEAVAGHHDRVRRQRQQPLVERLDDGREVPAVGRVARSAGKRVSPEKRMGHPSSRNEIDLWYGPGCGWRGAQSPTSMTSPSEITQS